MQKIRVLSFYFWYDSSFDCKERRSERIPQEKWCSLKNGAGGRPAVFSAAPEKAIIGSYLGQRPLRDCMSKGRSSSLSRRNTLRPSPINQIFTNN